MTTIEIGLVAPAGPSSSQTGKFLEDLDQGLPLLGSQVKSLWMTDHFFWNGDPTFEAWTVLSFWAARYPGYQIAPIVLGQSYRNPALLALMGATLQNLSGGRFIMGIGAGWKEDEYRAYGYPYPNPGTRIDQLEDTLEILKRLWTQPGKVTFHGKHYNIEDAWCEPKPVPVPKILVGGSGTRTMRLAARFGDLWNMPDTAFERYNERLQVLKQQCQLVGRDISTLRLSWFGRLSVARTEEEALARSGGKWNNGNAFVGTPQQVLAQMKPFIDAGVTYFMLEILGFPAQEVIEFTVAEVLERL
jgi:alkanesulfonate monooxygenase SsuD/methylene tetrahydromethanopterin reductase-like flavin-dependent oxidoreductase (luciferase family)